MYYTTFYKEPPQSKLANLSHIINETNHVYNPICLKNIDAQYNIRDNKTSMLE